ncbi:unnamed protein product, partial [marine sediment metagenome]
AKAGFGDKKKVLALAVLLTVGAGVTAYQFLGGSGPQEAAAVSVSAPAPGSRAAGATDVERVLERLDAGPQNEAGQDLSIDRVEEIVNTFDTYVQTRQVPLEGLRVNPFAVVRSKSQQDEQEQEQAQADEEAEAEARRSRIVAAARALKVGSILIVGDERKAIVGGKLCQVGDTIEGFRVEAIGTDCVRLSVEGETVELRLRPETDGR